MNVTANGVEAIKPIPFLQTNTLTADLTGKPVAATNAIAVTPTATVSPAPGQPLHRLGEIRQQEGLTRSRVARLLGISVCEVERQEQPSSDMLLSDLYRWQKVLAVPIAELLNEPVGELSRPVQLRAQLLRAMKTVRSIQEKARQASMRRLAEMLVNQLVEVIPEVKDTIAWPAVGPRRRKNDLGQAFFRRPSLRSLDELDRLEE